MTQKQIPTLVKTISVLYYIGAIYYFFWSFGYPLKIELTHGVDMLTFILKLPYPAPPTIFNIIYGILITGLVFLEFFVAKDLWRGKNWARISVIIFSIIGILIGIFLLIQGKIQWDFFDGIFTILTSGLIGGYLLLSKKVKKSI